jgi:hypothetical protein
MNVQPARSHLVLLASHERENRVGKRQRRIRAHGTTGQVARAATEKAQAVKSRDVV